MSRSEFGDEVTRLIGERGMSLRELARRVPVNAGQLSRVIAGKRTPSDDLARRCDEILTSGSSLQVLVASMRENDRTIVSHALLREWSASSTLDAMSTFTQQDLVIDRRQASRAIVSMFVGAALLEPIENHFWKSTAKSTGAPLAGEISTLTDSAELEQLEATARMFRNWDHLFGGGLRRKAVVGQLSEVSDLLRDRSGRPSSGHYEKRLFGVMAQLAETAAMMSWDTGQESVA